MNNRKKKVVVALMVSMFLAAFEGTVVSTAVPTIAKDLNGYNLLSWVFSAYLLTSAVSTPIYGKLSDIFGRKKTLSIGILIFIIGSALCATSRSMLLLVIFRALQGIGAGSIMTITFTIIGDIFELEERSKVQGCISTVWGASSLIGPFIGGFFIEYLSWHWIFLINVPFGILSIVLLNKNLKEHLVKQKAKIDYLGSLFLTIMIVSILLCVFSTTDYAKIGFSVIAIVSIFIFYFVEKRNSDPIIPFEVFNRDMIILNFIVFFIASVLMIIEVYTPLYTQNVLGYSAKISGLVMAPMSISWLLTSFIMVNLTKKFGENLVLQGSLVIIAITAFLLRFTGIHTSLFYITIVIFFMGAGFGLVLNSTIIVIQSFVSFEKRGATTSSNALIRTLGQTISVGIYGGFMNSHIASYFAKTTFRGVTADNIYKSGASHIQIIEAFFNGIHYIFNTLFFIIVLCIIVSIFVKSKDRLKDKNQIDQ